MSMKMIAVLFLLFVVCVVDAQETVLIAKPFHARSLAGTVVDPMGGAIPGAEIKLFTCPAGWPYSKGAPDFLSTTVADSKGHFSIDAKLYAKPYCLYVSARNFQQLEVRVQLSVFASELRLKLPVGV